MKNFKTCILFNLTLLVSACNNSIKYPEGGYDYPKHIADKDTNFYYYSLKDSFSRKDSVWDTNVYFFFQAFNEPNISLQPLGYDEFRLYYDAALGYTYFITVT
ncbi:MAG: hypothetical protein ABI405_10015, partial [Parafilimonas sp.]